MADTFKRYFEELSADYRRGLDAKFAELESLWCALTSGASAPGRIAELQRELHTMVGTAKTMGVSAVTDAARAAETYLEPFFSQGALPGPREQVKFRQLLDALKQSANQ